LSISRGKKKKVLTVFYLDGTQGTGGHTGAAAHTHFIGEQHRRFLRFFLFENPTGAGSGGLTYALVAGRGVALFEVNVRVLVHIRWSFAVYIKITI
jgi:hypothetical protein